MYFLFVLDDNDGSQVEKKLQKVSGTSISACSVGKAWMMAFNVFLSG